MTRASQRRARARGREMAAPERMAHVLLTSGIVLLAATVATGDPAWIRGAASVLALGTIAFAGTLARVLLHLGKRECSRPLAASLGVHVS